MQDYRRLRVVQTARGLVRATYAFTQSLPRHEQFGLVSQMRRAAISLALNIAEGCSRSSTRELVRFLEVSRGSGTELELALQITEDLGFGDPGGRDIAAEELNHTLRELSRLITSLRRRASSGQRE